MATQMPSRAAPIGWATIKMATGRSDLLLRPPRKSPTPHDAAAARARAAANTYLEGRTGEAGLASSGRSRTGPTRVAWPRPRRAGLRGRERPPRPSAPLVRRDGRRRRAAARRGRWLRAQQPVPRSAAAQDGHGRAGVPPPFAGRSAQGAALGPVPDHAEARPRAADPCEAVGGAELSRGRS